MIYLDNAATTMIKPLAVSRAVMKAMQTMASPGRGGHEPAMRETLSAAMGLPLDCVSVKATTEEGLGFTGESLGIAAHAVALIEKTK